MMELQNVQLILVLLLLRSLEIQLLLPTRNCFQLSASWLLLSALGLSFRLLELLRNQFEIKLSWLSSSV